MRISVDSRLRGNDNIRVKIDFFPYLPRSRRAAAATAAAVIPNFS